MIKNLLNKRKYITVSSVELNDTELNEDEKPNIPSGMWFPIKDIRSVPIDTFLP